MSRTDDTGNDEGVAVRNGQPTPNNRPSRSRPTVTAHTSDEGRTVFTESGNSDAWIATDVTLTVKR